MRTTSTRALMAGSLACGLMAVLAAPASAYPAPTVTRVVSLSRDGGPPDGNIEFSVPSSNGRFVVFYSEATNLTDDPPQDNVDGYVFLQDLRAGTTERVAPVGKTGYPVWGGLMFIADTRPWGVSNDGRFIVLTSVTPLTPEAPNGAHVYLFDRSTRTFRWLTENPDGATAMSSGIAFGPDHPEAAISSDGRFVVFYSAISHFAGDTNDALDVYQYDVEADTLARVSVTSKGHQIDRTTSTDAVANGTLDISDDGRFVAFLSDDPQLVPPPASGNHVFVHDNVTGKTVPADVDNNGATRKAHFSCASADMSADGRYVAFSSISDMAGTEDGPLGSSGGGGAFVRDMVAGRTERVSVLSDGTAMAKPSTTCRSPYISISQDGRYVVFNDFTPAQHFTLRDRIMEATRDLGPLQAPSLVDDGRLIVHLVGAYNAPADPLRIAVTDVGGGMRVMDMDATTPDSDRLTVVGVASFPGEIAGQASDPSADGAPVGPLAAAEMGTEIVGAKLLVRPEEEDLFFRVDFACETSGSVGTVMSTLYPDASCAWPGREGHGGVVYTVSFQTADTRYRIEATCIEQCGPPGKISNGQSVVPALYAPTPEAKFELFACNDTCTMIGPLSGGFDTTGPSTITVSVPQEAIGVSPGSVIGSMHFRSELIGDIGAATLLDQLILPGVTVPQSSVTLGLAPAGTPQGDVDFSTPTTLKEGAFSATLDLANRSGDLDLWARACYGTSCSETMVPVTSGGQ